MSEQKCLIESCDAKAVVRGLCRNCYGAARTLVKKGEATWEKLEAAGIVLPAKSGRPAGSGKKQAMILEKLASLHQPEPPPCNEPEPPPEPPEPASEQ